MNSIFGYQIHRKFRLIVVYVNDRVVQVNILTGKS